MATTWDSGNKSASISLGRMNVAAATNASSGVWKSVRATTSNSSGSLYLEFYSGYVGNNGSIIGFGNSSLNLASFPGSDTNSIGIQSQGSQYSLTGGTWQGWGMGYVIGIAIDLTNKKFWARTDRNTNWNNDIIANQNPATGTGGKTYTTTGALFPAWGGFGDAALANQNACCINTGGFTFAMTPPSGFSAWDSGVPTGTGSSGTQPTIWDSSNKNANVVITAVGGLNLIATQNSATTTWGDVRSTTSYNNGQLYYEITLTAYDGGNGFFSGVCDSSLGTANGVFPGNDSNSTGAQVGTNQIYWGNGGNTGQPTWSGASVGQVVGIAVDVNRGLIWWKNVTTNSNWNANASGDPIAGLRGAYIGTINNVFIAWGGDRNITSDSATLNTGASVFTGTVPTGYVAWDAGTQPSGPANRVRGNMPRSLMIR